MTKYIDDLKDLLEKLDKRSWEISLEVMLQAWRRDSNVWIAGNGGNLANALHFATDWNKGLFIATGRAMRARVISEGVSTYSAFANDFPFELSLQKSYEMHASTNDVVVAMTGGGSSSNIINLVNFAKTIKSATVVLLTGGKKSELFVEVDAHIHIPTQRIQLVEDIHATFGHSVLCHIIDNR